MERINRRSFTEMFANRLTKEMIKTDVIGEEKKEYMIYALELLFENVISSLIILVLGGIAGCLIETGLFLICFLALRKYSGGFHCEREISCYFLTILSYVGILITYTFINKNESWIIITILVAISFIMILAIGTVNHPNLRLDEDELCASRNRARLIAILICLSLIIAEKVGIHCRFLLFPGFSIILCAISLMLAKITKQEVKS
ncbi:MAG: accessory gene regulator B family protein [Lachnospiraceae bacterium]|nr:accessory gene regulator B family protein [Lachnospiraceae bacterium]